MSRAHRTLGGAAASGAKVSMIAQLVRVLIQAASVVVLSRILGASDFGLLAMSVAIVGVGELFRDFGLTQAAVQAPTLSVQQRTNLFWLNAGIGVALALVTFAASWPIALFYGDERLVTITQILSLTFVVNGLSTQYRASLMRQLRFGWLSVSEIMAQITGLAVAIVVATATGSYWALVFQQVVAATISLLVLIWVGRWVPGRFRRGHGMKQFLSFGGYLVAAQMITYASRNVDSIIIGARLGPTDLGFYNRAFQLLLVPLNQINAPATRVALPVLSKLQDERERFDRYVLVAQSILLQPVVAGFALAAAIAPFAIPLALGPGWEESVPLFQILAIGGCFQAAGSATYWVFLARGATKSQLLWAVTVRPIVIVAVLVGSVWGVTGVAIGFTVGTAIVWPIGLWWITRHLGAPGWAMLANGLRPFVVYGVAASGALAASHIVADPWGALLNPIAFLSVTGAALLSWPAFRNDLGALRHLLRGSRAKRSRGDDSRKDGEPQTDEAHDE